MPSLYRLKDKLNESFRESGVAWKIFIQITLLSKTNGIKTISRKNYDCQLLPHDTQTKPKSPSDVDKEKTSLNIREQNAANDFDDMRVAAAYDDIIAWYDRIGEVGDNVFEYINKRKVDH